MEAFFKDSLKSKGVEILYFERAEIEKITENSLIYAGTGSLSVLYFEVYNRFVLQINDWRYPLIRRLPIISENNLNLPTYILPAQKNSHYRLKLIDNSNIQGLKNFESILENNSRFIIKGQNSPAKQIEVSPEDGVEKQRNDKSNETIEQGLKNVHKVVANIVHDIKNGYKNQTSKKLSTSLKSIKTKDFRSKAKSTFKDDFFNKNEKRSQKFLKRRQENVNQTQIDRYEDLRTRDLPAHYIPSEQIEDIILGNKELVGNTSTFSDEILTSKIEQVL